MRALAVRRKAVFSEPSGLRISAWRTRIFWPRLPRIFSRTTPAKFWPKSYTRQFPTLVQETGENSSWAVTAGP